ncbi:MAG: FkbM family methyltransferase [Tannerella sp.]|nr:FkbM family methyltransferase [Tannerella sp.]
MTERTNRKKLRIYRKEWLIENGEESWFDIGGAKIPDISNDREQIITLVSAFEDTFTVPYFFEDNHDRSVVEYLDPYMMEGPYSYTDGAFDVTVQKEDTVIDAGAWIGDFSAYAANRGATVYAFEPVKSLFDLLCKTEQLNRAGRGKIYPVQKGLGNINGQATISIDKENSGSNSMIMPVGTATEKITLSTLDQFVEENKLKVDFIKADIEGAERDMLRGASHVLKTFAPKLAICTYHLPDDPEVLEKIILDTNPNYRIVHTRHKLFAAVINKPRS